MSIGNVAMTAAELAAFLASTSEYETLAQAIAQGGFYIVENIPTSTAVAVSGGQAIASYGTGTALELASQSTLTATKQIVKSATLGLAKGSTGYKAIGLTSMTMAQVAAVAAPFAGFAIGEGLYNSNPQLWTKISQKLLPFCYPGTNNIPTWIEIGEEAQTTVHKMLVKAGIIEEMKELVSNGDVRLIDLISIQSGSITVTGASPALGMEFGLTGNIITEISGSPMVYAIPYPVNCAVYIEGGSIYSQTPEGYNRGWAGPGWHYQVNAPWAPLNNLSESQVVNALNDPYAHTYTMPRSEGISTWQGTEAPAVPEVIPIIIVPEPVGPDYQPIPQEEPAIPITPIPLLPPYEPPLPLPPPNPEVDPPPENWPEEEPWPTVIPMPWPDPAPETDPDPDWPEVIPWPMPIEPPEEWPLKPTRWDEPYPEEIPWPREPEDWPEEVPWPTEIPIPEDWPEGVPWPESPEEWPETVPWPVPWPENWPEEEPWPIKWPEELPYPVPFPYPTPTPNEPGAPEPGQIDNPDTEIDPYIQPAPAPDGKPEPVQPTKPTNPYDDPTEPQPYNPPDPTVPDPTQPAPPTSEGEPPFTLDPIPYVPLPFSSETGLISVYHPSQSQLLTFWNWLWVTWQDATIEKIWNNPFDGVITLFELYCTPTDVGAKTIRSGFLNSGVMSPIISRYTQINCGSVGVPEYYGNYLDYAPYTKAYIYLPFIGVVELNADDIVGHAVNVTYKIDEYNGSCIAQITVAKVDTVNGETVEYNNVFYQFSGNCSVELPITGGSQAAIKAGMIQAAAYGLTSVIGGIINGGSDGGVAGALSGAASGLAYGAANAVNSLVSAKSSVQHSGSFGSSFGALGIKKPFITVVRPKQLQIANYNELYGYQAHKAVRIGDCTGYLRCREVHVISPTASDDEKSRIEELLKTGVYVTE